MSYIPNNAMPHATADVEFGEQGEGHRSIFRWLSDTAHDNPKKAIGAGAAVLAGAVVAASIPFIAPSKPKPRRKASTARAAGAAKARARTNGAGARSDGATNGSKPKSRAKASRAKAAGGKAAGTRRAGGARRRSGEGAGASAG